MCKTKKLNEALGGGIAHRQTPPLERAGLWFFAAWHGRPAQRKHRLLMTAHEPVTLRSLHHSKLAPRASPASCPLPSVSESGAPRAAGASCQPAVTTAPAPALRVLRQPVHMESSVLTVPFELQPGRRRINKLQANRQSSTSLRRNPSLWLCAPQLGDTTVSACDSRCYWGCS